MKHKKPPVQVIILFIVVVLVGGYYGITSLRNNDNQLPLVSGTVEADEVTISPELAGKVVEVFVEEGALVKTGDPLFRLDDELLQGQREVSIAGLNSVGVALVTSAAALETARANYQLAVNSARMDASINRTQDWNSSLLPGYNLPGGYFTQQELLEAARNEVESERIARNKAIDELSKKQSENSSKDFLASEDNLLAARTAQQTALDVLTRAKISANQELMEVAQAAYDAATNELESAQSEYDDLKDSDAGIEIISLRLNLSVSQERFEAAQDLQLKLEIGDASPKLLVAKYALDQAKQAVSQAEAAVALAEAQLALINLQLDRLLVIAPCEGVILTRSIEIGELVNATSTTFKIGKLHDLYITVFVPEEIYGTLSLGQPASLVVDSYPGETFSARIVNIADQAEFTPRNVQTIEGRKATVFAVKLKLADLLGRLKPGMPADVTFLQ